MTLYEEEKFEEFLLDSFSNGKLHRELRLSTKEVEYIKKNFENANLKKIFLNEDYDGRDWFEVKLM